MNSEATGKIKTAIRFNNRVENYAAYRPGYPAGVVDFLREELKLSTASIVADVGSGTGLLSELFLQNGNEVFGVEPNDEMRAAAAVQLQTHPNFKSVKGTAEATTLADASFDFVTAGQAFHWFDTNKARTEFARILKPGGYAVIIWNLRRTNSTPFLRDYEALLRRVGTDYDKVAKSYAKEEDLHRFFDGNYQIKKFDNSQIFDFAGLRGRTLSASYVPLAGQPGHEEMLAGLREIFNCHQHNGTVEHQYDTEIYYGKVISSQ